MTTLLRRTLLTLPPLGPVALVCFAAGALLVERARTRAIAPTAREQAPAGVAV
jgi:hypothetical protein